MHPRTEISETVLCQASANVDSHPMLCAVQEMALTSTEQACLDDHALLDWDEYRSVAL
jgi:hypothetical protein